jgi:hypothetical protein
MKRLLSIITLLLCLSPAFVWAQICPGQVWTDTQGEPINAHGKLHRAERWRLLLVR